MDGERPIENRVEIFLVSWVLAGTLNGGDWQVFDECGLKIMDILVVK
jgi:hypothetical protein